MIFQKNEKCPVCDKFFTDNDDIVICPDCGTPHHRECYNSLGHCANSDKHSEGFEYEYISEQKDAESSLDDTVQGSVYYQPNGEDSRSDNENDTSPMPDFMSQFKTDTAYDNSEETIDGKKIGDVAAVVRTNTQRFIPKFKRNKNISWNWSAFIFGPYYLFFRKMIAPGVIFLALSLIVQLFAMGFYAEQYNAYAQFITSNVGNYSELMNMMANPSAELLDIANGIKPMFNIIIVCNLVLRTIIALFADKLYRIKVLKVLDNVDEKLKNGGSFNQNPLFSVSTNLTQEQMKKLYLGKLGGTSIFTPLIAMMSLDIIVSLIQRL